MSTISEIEAAISILPPEELTKLREWFQEFDADSWDRQIETDVHAGRLDALAEEALSEFHAGRSREM